MIASRDPVWLQESFDVLTGLFELIGRFTNAATKKIMVCIPGRIQEGTEEECADYKSQTVHPPPRSIVVWIVRLAAPALRLDPVKVNWRRSIRTRKKDDIDGA